MATCSRALNGIIEKQNRKLKPVVDGFSSGLMLGATIMVAILFQSLNLPVRRELATVLFASLGCALVILVSGIRTALKKKTD